MGGTIDIFMKSFAGLEILKDRISLNPKLPPKWKKTKFNVRYKNIWFAIELTKKKATILAEPLKELMLQPSAEIPINIREKQYKLSPGVAKSISL